MSYRPRLEGTIPLEGYCCIRIAVDDCVCLLTVSSKTHNGMRILSIQPTFRLRNETQCHLKSGCLLASDRTKMYSAQKARWSQTPVKHCQPAGGSRSVRTATPLLFWRSEDDQNGADAPNAFLSFRLCSIWSCPIQLSLPNPRNPPSGPHRHCLSIPISAGCGIVEGVKPISSAVICTSLELDGLVYLTLIPDPNPHWILVNQTALTLAYGQASDSEPHQIEWHCDQFQVHFLSLSLLISQIDRILTMDSTVTLHPAVERCPASEIGGVLHSAVGQPALSGRVSSGQHASAPHRPICRRFISFPKKYQ